MALGDNVVKRLMKNRLHIRRFQVQDIGTVFDRFLEEFHGRFRSLTGAIHVEVSWLGGKSREADGAVKGAHPIGTN